VTDRDLRSRLPQVELQQLPGPIRRALIRPRALEQRPDLAQVVIEDRLRTLVAELNDQLADALARDARIVAQQAMDLVLEGVQLRRPRRALIARRPVAPQRAAHRVAVMTGAPDDLVDREPLNLAHPSDLRPAPHVEHRLPPRRSHDQARLGITPDTTDNPSDRVRFQPAQAGDYSRGAHSGSRRRLAAGTARTARRNRPATPSGALRTTGRPYRGSPPRRSVIAFICPASGSLATHSYVPP
jgi:hypothetical protein